MSFVNFSISGEFVTRHARDLWCERQFAKAIAFMDTIIGMDLETKYNILSGKQRLTGVNDMHLEDEEERITHHNGVYLLSLHESYEYKDLCSLKDKLDLRCANINGGEERVGSPIGLIPKVFYACDAVEYLLRWWNPEDEIWLAVKKVCIESMPYGEFTEKMYQELFKLLGLGSLNTIGAVVNSREEEIDPEIVEEALELPERFKENIVESMVSNGTINEGDARSVIKVILEGGEEIEEKPTPWEEDKALNARHGWLDRRGRFYGCSYMGHQNLADAIVGSEVHTDGSQELESKGWLKLANMKWYTFFVKKMTKSQKDFIMLWGTVNEIDVEEYLRD